MSRRSHRCARAICRRAKLLGCTGCACGLCLQFRHALFKRRHCRSLVGGQDVTGGFDLRQRDLQLVHCCLRFAHTAHAELAKSRFKTCWCLWAFGGQLLQVLLERLGGLSCRRLTFTQALAHCGCCFEPSTGLARGHVNAFLLLGQLGRVNAQRLGRFAGGVHCTAVVADCRTGLAGRRHRSVVLALQSGLLGRSSFRCCCRLRQFLFL